MAQYREDFSGNSPVGPAPTGWTTRWHTSDFNVSTVADATAFGGVVMRIDSTVTNRHLITYDAVDSESPDTRDDAEILVRFKSADLNDTFAYTFAMIVRGSGTDTTETGYNSFLYDDNGEFRVGKYDNGSGSDFATNQDGAAHFDFSANLWIWGRLRINGSTLSVKWWQEEETQPNAFHRYEPPYWQYTTTNSDITAAGWIGVLHSDTGAGPFDVDYVGIGTNGDVAPYPNANLQTLRMTQQVVQVAVQMADTEVRVKQQMLQALVQNNPSAPTGAPIRNIIVGM